MLAFASAGCKGASGAAAGEIAAAVATNVVAGLVEGALRGSGESGGTDGPDPVPGAPRALDVEHARAVLLDNDLRSCWPQGVPHGPGEVQVTFQSDGTVTRVAVVRPAAGPPLDNLCAAALLREVIIDPFDGDPVVVRVTFGAP
jgi:hypothetical protein